MERCFALENALLSAATDRSLEEYLDDLGLTVGDLKGLVLDLGSGKGDVLSRQASVQGVKVVSVNPMLVKEIERNKRKDVIENYDVRLNAHKSNEIYVRIPDLKRTVASLAQNLPFPNESFDTILSLYAVPLWIDNHERSFTEVFKETYRVLKPGGKAFLGPIGSSYLKRIVLNKLDIPYKIMHSPKNKELKRTGIKILDSSKNIYITKPLKENSV